MTNIADLEFKKSNFGGANDPKQKTAFASDVTVGEIQIQHGVWESGPGQFELYFNWHETMFILEGDVVVLNLESGKTLKLSAGDLAFFEKGSHWRWTISENVKKVFTIVD